MNKEEQQYLDLAKHILENGSIRQDRTGVGTKSIFGSQLRFSLMNNQLPLLTTRKIYVKSAIEELLFFIRGETNSKLLEEKNVNIWKGNTSREFLDQRGLFNYPEGEMGPMYGAQWRNFNGNDQQKGIDQLQNAFNLIKNDPFSRRIMVSAYNPSQSHLGVLEPCHTFFQFYVEGSFLSCQWYQRSVDFGIGFPTNLVSYSVLTHLMAWANGLTAKEVIFTGGDTHIYSNHFTQIKEQISREPKLFPQIYLENTEQYNKIYSLQDIENLSFKNFRIENYEHHDPIKMSMAI